MFVTALASGQQKATEHEAGPPSSTKSETDSTRPSSPRPSSLSAAAAPATAPNAESTDDKSINNAEPTAAESPNDTASQEAASVKAPAETKSSAELEQRLLELEDKNAHLEEELEILREDQQWTQQQVDKVMPLTSRLAGYVDFGFFYVSGDGRGIRTDIGHANFPEYDGVVADSWVFMGDPLSTAINSRGDPADVNESRAVTNEQIGNGGKPSFILNNINLQLFTGVGDNLTINGMVDFVPRGRDVSASDQVAFGDFIDVKLGYVSYRIPTSSVNLELFAGKFDSVLGIEYRTQESPQRITVTPSLICRYTCGRPLGLKARAGFFDNALLLNTAVTNGSHSTEGFPIYDETDSNSSKTASGRLSYEFDLGAGLELGASGAYGAQDRQTENDVIHWHYGFDARLDVIDFVLNAEFVQGELQGQSEPGEPPCSLAQCLEYKGAYGLAGYRVTNWLMPYARVDWRSALHRSGASFVYISDLIRPTGGLRFDLGTHIVVKAEYIFNREIADVPEFSNDVFTTSLVGKL
jgi:hypothetical protein